MLSCIAFSCPKPSPHGPQFRVQTDISGPIFIAILLRQTVQTRWSYTYSLRQHPPSTDGFNLILVNSILILHRRNIHPPIALPKLLHIKLGSLRSGLVESFPSVNSRVYQALYQWHASGRRNVSTNKPFAAYRVQRYQKSMGWSIPPALTLPASAG